MGAHDARFIAYTERTNDREKLLRIRDRSRARWKFHLRRIDFWPSLWSGWCFLCGRWMVLRRWCYERSSLLGGWKLDGCFKFGVSFLSLELNVLEIDWCVILIFCIETVTEIELKLNWNWTEIETEIDWNMHCLEKLFWYNGT